MTGEPFDGASAIVSGGAGGLGEATVRRLHVDGLGVVIADLAEDVLGPSRPDLAAPLQND